MAKNRTPFYVKFCCFFQLREPFTIENSVTSERLELSKSALFEAAQHIPNICRYMLVRYDSLKEDSESSEARYTLVKENSNAANANSRNSDNKNRDIGCMIELNSL